MNKQSKLNEFFENNDKKNDVWKELRKIIKIFGELKKDIEKEKDLSIIKENLEGLILKIADINSIIDITINNQEKNQKNNNSLLSDQIVDLLKSQFNIDSLGSILD